MRDRYFWTNRASVLNIERMRQLLPDLPEADTILKDGEPRYPAFVVESIERTEENRHLDFLVEYDIYNPSQGIYFGCKITTLNGTVHRKNCFNALEEWEQLKPIVVRRLNNLFSGTDFTHRFLPTDNCYDSTFWPFWISAPESENLKDFSCRVLTEIAKVYREYFDGGSQMPTVNKSAKAKRQKMPKDAFSQEVYSEFLSYIENVISRECSADRRDELKVQAVALTEKFVEKGIGEGFFRRADGYELALMTNGCKTDIEFKALMDAFFDMLARPIGVDCMMVPWSKIIRLFIRPDERPYGIHLKTQSPKDDTRAWANATAKRLSE